MAQSMGISTYSSGQSGHTSKSTGCHETFKQNTRGRSAFLRTPSPWFLKIRCQFSDCSFWWVKSKNQVVSYSQVSFSPPSPSLFPLPLPLPLPFDRPWLPPRDGCSLGGSSFPILWNNRVCVCVYPRWSMYGLFTNIGPINHPNVGKYTIHGSSGYVCIWIDGCICVLLSVCAYACLYVLAVCVYMILS